VEGWQRTGEGGWALFFVLLVFAASGCVTAPVEPPVLAGTQSPMLHAASAVSDASLGSAPAAEDQPYDPFARESELADTDYDPWESFNSVVFEFNRQVDRYVLKPVAQGYNFVLPDAAQVGIKNLYYHARFPVRFLNNLFQGKFKGAEIELGRFILNTAFGFGGFVDVATDGKLVTPEEDTGQTFGFYGAKPGPYLVLPFLPPLTVRDGIGYLGDIALNPINWLVFPIIEVEGIPSVVAHKNRSTTGFAQIGMRAEEILNERSLNLEKFQGVEEATLDLYTAVRNAYLQKRAKAIRE
jgi:phospholipid-binding lipoprotein MlaA